MEYLPILFWAKILKYKCFSNISLEPELKEKSWVNIHK